MLQRTLPAGFIAPCLPTKTDKLPSGGEWLHEIKDGFRVIARKQGAQVKLYSRPGMEARLAKTSLRGLVEGPPVSRKPCARPIRTKPTAIVWIASMYSLRRSSPTIRT